MNVIKKQLKLTSGLSGMKKAVSTSNLSDNVFLEIDCSPHNLTLENRNIKSKSLSSSSQDLTDLLGYLYTSITDKSNEDFSSDELPKTLSTDWIKSNESKTKLDNKNATILEMLNTELNYLNQMQFLLDVSSKVFTNIQQRYFSYINSDDIFLNLGEIYEANYQFWVKYFYPSFEMAKKGQVPISCSSWKTGFNQIGTIFSPYQVYCSRMIQFQDYLHSLKKDKYFMQFLEWFPRTEQSSRASFSDFMTKPFQRLTKYKLLLTTIANYSEQKQEQDDLAEMISSVDGFLKEIESKLTMADLSMRIGPIDFVDPPTEDLMELCSPYRHLDLTIPINSIDGDISRQMIKEGSFKLKEAQSKIFEVSLVLFTDLILICHKIKNIEFDRIKVIKPVIPLCKLDTISPLPGSLVLRVIDDFGCLASMYLLTNAHSTTNEWIEAIQNAQHLIKNISICKPNYKPFPMLKVNVINSSPLTGRSPTPTDCSSPGPTPLSPQMSSFNRTESFSRSNFGSSPIIRRRMNGTSPTKCRSGSLHENYFVNHDGLTMNRSLSQLSILENDDDQEELCNLDLSTCSIDFRSDDAHVTVNSHDDLDVTLTDGDNNCDAGKMVGHCDIKVQVNGRTKDRLNEMRQYGSMMDLSAD